MTIVGQRGRVSPSTVTFSVSSWQKKRSQFGLFGVVVSLTHISAKERTLALIYYRQYMLTLFHFLTLTQKMPPCF